MPNVVDDLTGEVIGSVKSYGKPRPLSRGPCVFGVVPFVPGEDFPSRALAAMRESPTRDPKRPGQPLWHRVDGHLVFEPALDAAQAYEPHGVTLGLAQAISKHGAAQRLLGALFEAAPEIGGWVRERGYESCGAGICEAPGAWSDEDDEDREVTGWFTDDLGDEGEPVALDVLRSEHFVVTVHRALGGRLPGVSSDEQARLAAISQTVQVRFFWGMVMERWDIVRATGWGDAAEADERVAFICASLAINAARSIMRSVLAGAKAKTAAALTESRVRVYSALGKARGWGADFGRERAHDEGRMTALRVAGRTVEGIIRDGAPAALVAP